MQRENFIKYFDSIFEEEKRQISAVFGDESINEDFFSIHFNLDIIFATKKINTFLVRKDKKTRFLINKEGVKIYLTDIDILELLINNQEVIGLTIMKEILEFFQAKINCPNKGEEYHLEVRKIDELEPKSVKKYKITGLKLDEEDKELDNKYGLEKFMLSDLLQLISLVISKDIFSEETVDNAPDYLKRTLYKYIIMIKLEIFKDERVKEVLRLNELYDDGNNWISILFKDSKSEQSFFKDIKKIEELEII